MKLDSTTLQSRGFRLVSTVSVDSGQIMIVDPCYVLKTGDYADGKSYESILSYYEDTNYYEPQENETEDQRNQGINPWGEGMGYITSSGYGDGLYAVYARYTDGSDGWGVRVAQVLIDFIGEEEEYDDEEEDTEEFCPRCSEFVSELVYNHHVGYGVCDDCDFAIIEESEEEAEDRDEL